MKIIIRKANKADLPEVLNLIKELALYEKAPDEVTITIEELEKDGFGDQPMYEVILAESDEEEIIGMSFYYYTYSTWKGKCLYLEDIIVKEEFRGKGIGKQLFDATVLKAKEVKAKRMMWQVLDWNTPAIEFYKQKYKAEISSEWLNGRLTEEQIQHFTAN
ncbi:MAG: GNAT family N-acetyltransferase [Bacteroidetes bacterium]|jgi:GNAT superfamily N-acetyltransferase|nr:GNAT family N-acetyltransferase [Bacteroidota bacterium]MBT5530994.1 GNAT family N-acetyltransferase [Cytophagia bacterium]MBT3424649.1 GNAT family N-acetyltransferase [Bacteroidota bacterium]MBT3799879.1 GNAT family N-acetyltransferase [Bacteroidota bacterium]MBT3935172.1 GNAT family N-acetyltransferase [Bacteroidota bacterium]